MGPTVDEALGRGEVHPLEELADLGAHVGARGLAVQQQGTFEVVADAVEGVQGGEGVLEDHLDVVAVASQGPAAGADRGATQGDRAGGGPLQLGDRKSTRLNSSHVAISYAVFCL